MTSSQFAEECGKRLIEPAIAIENESIVAALRERDDLRVIELLNSEF